MADEKPPDSVPFYLNSSINYAIGLAVVGVNGILEGLCQLGIVCIHFATAAWTSIAVGVYTIGAAGVWAYRRIKLGNDPRVPLPKITAGPVK